ncbi:DHS-like NAD/FAD-binding domain-containing protein [Gongronella butleri]|nr:DHS-like NAD/FAD-binding domain-containing protein [Gongronella butleri]
MPPTSRSKTKAKKEAAVLTANTMDAIAEYIQKAQVNKIIVMTGAGISTAAGIPDFRSKDTGLYDNLQRFDLPYAEAIFDIDYFEERPEPFYALAKELFPGKYFPTKTHYFIRLLHEKNKLLRNFTQNIDTLERISGLDGDMVIEAHGSFASASCIECDASADMDEVKRHILDSNVPRCDACKGLVKPDITFFGQSLPKRFFKRLTDFDDADLLIVIGTSLQVQPFASLIDNVPDHVPRLLINKDKAGEHQTPHHGFDFKWKYGKKRDALFLGDCDQGCEKLAELLGWKDELNRLHSKGNEKLKAQWDAEKLAEELNEKAKIKDEEDEKANTKEEAAVEEPEPKKKEDAEEEDKKADAKDTKDTEKDTEKRTPDKDQVAKKDEIDALAEELEKRLNLPSNEGVSN